MAAQFKEIKIPLTNMTWSPDLPAASLGPNEYNDGSNVETDRRAIRSVLGDENILSQIPGTPIFVTGGYRTAGTWSYVVANSSGRWYAITAAGITNITPGVGADPNAALSGYSLDMAITASWNGTILFVNDGVGAPLYLTPADTEMREYDAAPDNYTWNYNPDWSSLTAGFMRIFSTPNVGSILIAGNLTADVVSSGTTINLPYTVRWSQAFGLDSGPVTWEPTLTNVANELEIPVRGPVLDGFPLNGNFYVCSYWDTVAFSPISYQGSSTPVLGVRLQTQGRGLLNENCWAAGDGVVFGLDARDIWVFNGSQFKTIGNQRVKDYFYSNLNASYTSRVFAINNTSKNQFEIYYPSTDSSGWCDQMISYRYDLDIWNPPRTVSGAAFAAEGPVYSSSAFNPATRGVVYVRATTSSYLVQKDRGTSFLGSTPIASEFRRDNISLGQEYSRQLLVHRILPEVTGTGNITVTLGGSDSVGSAPTFKSPVVMAIDTTQPWTQINQNAYRINTISVSGNSAVDTWALSAVNWQFTITEDAR